MVAVVLFLGSGWWSATAEGADLRRPYEAALAVSYGFDNRPSQSGCTDYECGTICYHGHSGSDFPLSFGTNVLAGADGVVSATNNSCADYGSLGNTCGGRCGNYVQIRHPNGDRTIYCHMRRNSLEVSTGDSVTCGQVIGQSASSGSSTGPHLHLGWRPGGGSSTDVYRGSCNSSPGAWRNQPGYGQPPGDECGCVPSPEVCDGQDNNCDGVVDSGDVCEVELLHRAPHSYAQTRTSDVNGDGVQDICARAYAGFRCRPGAPEEADGWAEEWIVSELMAETNGWGHPEYYSTIRMGDIDGDGLADVCARHRDGLTCWRSTGDGFEEFDTNASFSDASGWGRPQYYTTIRLADINGNGRDDLCARGASGWRCYLSEADGFGERIDGPDWSDAQGFNRPMYYGTIRTGDIDGDGREDVCMREPEGFVCYRSTGTGFEHLVTLPSMSDQQGWGNIIYWPSIRLADINGEGRSAVCARDSTSLFCRRFDGESFGEKIVLGGLSNDTGWADPTNYATLRVGDLTGDGSAELCIRANARMLCYGINGEEVQRWNGPEWSNANGWEAPANHGPLFITDLHGEGPGALCGRSTAGLVCQRFGEEGFESYPDTGNFSDGGGWTARKYYSTMRMGRAMCRGERCLVEPEPDPEGEGRDDEEWIDGEETRVELDDEEGGAGDMDNDEPLRRVTTSSCATLGSQGPAGPVVLIVLAFFLLGGVRRGQKQMVSLLVMLGMLAGTGCERSEESPAAQERAEALAVEEGGRLDSGESPSEGGGDAATSVSGSEDRWESVTTLAIFGDLRVFGVAEELPFGADGPRQYRPLFVGGDEVLDWPFPVEVISEALIMEGPSLFALGLDGTLWGESRDGEVQAIASGVISQVSVARDGCCLAYILDDHRGQILEVYRPGDQRREFVELGYSLGWAPVVSAEAQEVAWTASPRGHASMIVAPLKEDGEPRMITNHREGQSSDELDPFPTGVHMPMWIDEGIAFEMDGVLWLIDSEGNYLGRADGQEGMFWDAEQRALINRKGEVIRWESLK